MKSKGLERLFAGAVGLAVLGGSFDGKKVNAAPITIETYLPETQLIADGTTVYEMRIKVNSSIDLRSTNWKVYVPMTRFTLAAPPLQPQIPTTGDYFEGVSMDPSYNFVDTTLDSSGYLQPNTRNTAGAFGHAGTGDLEVIYFTVPTTAPPGEVTCQHCPENFELFGINFGDPQGTPYTIGNGGVSLFEDGYTIVAS